MYGVGCEFLFLGGVSGPSGGGQDGDKVLGERVAHLALTRPKECSRNCRVC